MKKLFTWLVLATLGAALVACQGPQLVAYKTLKSVGETVNLAMQGYADAVVAGAVEANDQVKVQNLYEKYRTAFNKAVDVARYDYTAPVPSEVAGLAAELTALVASYVK